MEQIENYKILPLNRSEDLRNKIFGDFKVIYRTETPKGIDNNSKSVYWLCQCQKCNKYVLKRGTALRNNKNICDCSRKNAPKDLTGQIFGKLTVLYPTDKRKNNNILWHCKCECGKECDVRTGNLQQHNVQSCGCLAINDLKNQRFGKLIALYPTEKRSPQGTIIWKCLCDCGNECEVTSDRLKSGNTQSCGCLHSKNEAKIEKILKENNIPYQSQYIFSDLLKKKFDFYINNQYIIEFDGQQHFNPSWGWNTEEHFNQNRKNDLIKNQYCFDNNIPLIRIPYNEEYDLNDLKLETTRFLLTKENEEKYYERS